MPPEQENTLKPVPSEPTPFFERKIVWISLAIIILLGAGAYFFIHQNSITQPPAYQDQGTTLPEAQAPVSTTDGYIYFEYFNTNEGNEKDNGLLVTLKIHDNVASTTKDLIKFSGAKDFIYPASLLSLYHDTVYFVNATGQLSTVDSNLVQVRVVPIGLQAGEFVSDYLFDGGFVYYLAGPFCNEYRGACDGTLRAVDMTTGKVRAIATHIDKGSMAGFDTTHSNLYFSGGFADAGCYVTQISELNLATNKISDLPSFGGCSDDPDIDQVKKKESDFFNNLVPKRTAVDYLQWNGNILQKSTAAIGNDDGLRSNNFPLPIQVY